MRVDIVPSGSVNLDMMADLGELGDELREAGLAPVETRASLPGIKDGGLTIAIALGGLVVSSISSLVSVLSYWSSRKPRYTVTVEAGPSTLTVSELDRAGVQAALKKIQAADHANGLLVRITEA